MLSIIASSIIGGLTKPLTNTAVKSVIDGVIGGSTKEQELAGKKLALAEAQGTNLQREWRPRMVILLGGVMWIHLLMPIVAEVVHYALAVVAVFLPVFESMPKFPWRDIWQTSGLATSALLGTFSSIYGVSRGFEKVNAGLANNATGAAVGGIAEALQSAFTGKPLEPVEVKRNTKIKPIPVIEKPKTPRNPEALNIAELRKEIIEEEGVKYEIYFDSLGKKTFGIGHLARKTDPEYDQPAGMPVSKERVQQAFNVDLKQAIRDAKAVVEDFNALPKKAKHVLVNMSFQLGKPNLSKFQKMLSAIDRGDWAEASEQALDSRWARQTPLRAQRMAARLASIETDIQI